MSDSEDENFCFYGKALEPYDEDAVPKKKPISVEDQIATDAQGRRRFHGAFTGGFSAGFYNTVGSLEGWRPTEFKSSRGEKALAKQSRPEDFMDDEDVGEHGIAPQTVKATNDYTTNRKRKKQIFSDGPIPGEPVLHTLITSGNETIGYLLMKNMDLKQRSKDCEIIDTEAPKVYGCVMPKTYEIKRSIDYDDIIPALYASYIKNPKSNTFGLGYEGLDKSHLSLFKPTQLVVKDKDNKKLAISGQAFGVGAFEQEDDDIYAKDDMSQYDFELTSEKKVTPKSNKPNTFFDKFILSKAALLPSEVFQPPVIPHSFTGKHKVKKSRFEPIPEEKVERRDMTAAIRAKYIGEDHIDDVSPSSIEAGKHNPAPIIDTSKTIKKDVEIRSETKNFATDLFLDKFVSASQPENLHNILEEVTPTEHGTQEMRDAAKLKMYGPLTRVISDWQPCSLLCKRFNVREPLLDDKIKKNERKKNHIIFEYQKNMDENMTLQPGLRITKEELLITANSTPTPESDIKEDIPEVVKEATNPSEESPVNLRNNGDDKNTAPLDITDRIDISKNIDLFKAVFLSSSESESEDENKKEEEEKDRENMMKENVMNELLVPKIKSAKEGILSHIKFNPLFRNKNAEVSEESTSKKNEENDTSNSINTEVIQEIIKKDFSMYGPALPDKIQTPAHTYVPDVGMDDEWVEKSDSEKKKLHKHKKKHKKEKHHKKDNKSKHRK